MACFGGGTAYVEPDLCGDIVYEDDEYAVKRCWKWNVDSIYEDEETEIIRALIHKGTSDFCGVYAFASKDGKRLCSIDFDRIGDFHEGFARVIKSGYGYGFVDKDLNLVIPMCYEDADDFYGGIARVKRNGNWLHIYKSGEEVEPTSPGFKYQDVGNFNEGMCKVSTLKLACMDLAYHSDYSDIAGIWGFINETGEEVIKPQYIYAQDFYNGIAVVCKGKWTIDKKWDSEHNTGRYWTEGELWGAIDKDGNAVIPFIFDEIKYFFDADYVIVNGVFMAHYGGWENVRWGVIDSRGNWLVKPIFHDIDYKYKDGLFAFYQDDKCQGDVLLGIYDINQKKIIFEPQFLDVSFCDDGWINVEVYNKQLGKTVEKLIDKNGNEKFHSIYSSIHYWNKPYEVFIRDGQGDRQGLIDENGIAILPCEYDIIPGGIFYEQKLVIFQHENLQGIKDFDGNVIIEPKYFEIRNVKHPMFIVKAGEKDNYKEGVITRNGNEVIPADFNKISWLRDNYFVCCKNGLCEMYKLIQK